MKKSAYLFIRAAYWSVQRCLTTKLVDILLSVLFRMRTFLFCAFADFIVVLKICTYFCTLSCENVTSLLLVYWCNPLTLYGAKAIIMPHRITKLVHWPLIGGLFIWYSEEGPGRGLSPPRPLLAVPNVTAHPSTASVPITVLLYNGPLLCGFNVPIKG